MLNRNFFRKRCGATSRSEEHCIHLGCAYPRWGLRSSLLPKLPQTSVCGTVCRSKLGFGKASGQTTMIMLILVIIVFVGMAVFLISLAKSVSQAEYINTYTHSMLSSILKTDTGFSSPSCKTISDLLVCSFLTPQTQCGSQSCQNLAEEKVNLYVSKFADLKQGFKYLLTVEPAGFSSGSGYSVEIGDPGLKTNRTEKFTAQERIQKVFLGSPRILDVRLTISQPGR